MTDTIQPVNHGTSAAYDGAGCRCDVCRGYQAMRVRRNRRERVAAGRLTHGTRSAYDAGCRCPACKDARKVRYAIAERGAS